MLLGKPIKPSERFLRGCFCCGNGPIEALNMCGSSAQRAVAGGRDATIAVRARDGRRVWDFPGGKYANPVVADSERVYVTGRSAQYAFAERGSPAAREDARHDRRAVRRAEDRELGAREGKRRKRRD